MAVEILLWKQTGHYTIIYLDNHATTRPDPQVLEAMLPFFTEDYANAASNHSFAHEAVKLARRQVSHLTRMRAPGIDFYSGATEVISLVIKDVVESYVDWQSHVITLQTGHTAVLDVRRYLEALGCEATYFTYAGG